MKTVRIVVMLLLALVGIVGGIYFVWNNQGNVDRRAFDSLDSLVAETTLRFPQCVDFEKLMLSRVTGTNGGPALLRAGEIADLLTDEGYPLRRFMPFDMEWWDLDSKAADLILSETAEFQREFNAAAESDSIVVYGTAANSRSRSLPAFNAFDMARLRINALATSGRLEGARAETLAMARVIARVDFNTDFGNSRTGVLIRSSNLRWIAANLSWLEPNAALCEELSSLASQSRANVRFALEGEVALLLWQARNWILVDEYRSRPKSFYKGRSTSVFKRTSYTFRTFSDFIEAVDSPLRATLSVLEVLDDATFLDTGVAKSAFNALLQHESEHPSNVWGLRSIDVPAGLRGELHAMAAELLLRVRCLEDASGIDVDAANELARAYPALRLMWPKGQVQVHADPAAAVTKFAIRDYSKPLESMDINPSATEAE